MKTFYPTQYGNWMISVGTAATTNAGTTVNPTQYLWYDPTLKDRIAALEKMLEGIVESDKEVEKEYRRRIKSLEEQNVSLAKRLEKAEFYLGWVLGIGNPYVPMSEDDTATVLPKNGMAPLCVEFDTSLLEKPEPKKCTCEHWMTKGCTCGAMNSEERLS